MEVLSGIRIDFKAISDAVEIPMTFKPTSYLCHLLLIQVFMQFHRQGKERSILQFRTIPLPFIHFLNISTCPGKFHVALRIAHACWDGCGSKSAKQTKGNILITYFKEIPKTNQLKNDFIKKKKEKEGQIGQMEKERETILSRLPMGLVPGP